MSAPPTLPTPPVSRHDSNPPPPNTSPLSPQPATLAFFVASASSSHPSSELVEWLHFSPPSSLPTLRREPLVAASVRARRLWSQLLATTGVERLLNPPPPLPAGSSPIKLHGDDMCHCQALILIVGSECAIKRSGTQRSVFGSVHLNGPRRCQQIWLTSVSIASLTTTSRDSALSPPAASSVANLATMLRTTLAPTFPFADGGVSNVASRLQGCSRQVTDVVLR
jgi:hypothetical protein